MSDERNRMHPLERQEATQPDPMLREGRARGWLIIFSTAIALVVVMTVITVSGWHSQTAQNRQGAPAETTGSATTGFGQTAPSPGRGHAGAPPTGQQSTPR